MNNIPESVVKEWEDASGYDEGTSQMVAYLSGRQDEYRKRDKEIDNRDNTIERQFNQQKFMASEFERLIKLIEHAERRHYRLMASYMREEITEDDYWNDFKTNHNI